MKLLCRRTDCWFEWEGAHGAHKRNPREGREFFGEQHANLGSPTHHREIDVAEIKANVLSAAEPSAHGRNQR